MNIFSVCLRYTNKRVCPESCRAAKYDEECQILRVMGFLWFPSHVDDCGGVGEQNRKIIMTIIIKICSEETNIATWTIVILNSSYFSQSQYISSTMQDMVRWSLNLGSMVVQLPPKSSGNCFLRLNRGWRWLIFEPDHILVRSHLNIRSRYGQE